MFSLIERFYNKLKLFNFVIETFNKKLLMSSVLTSEKKFTKFFKENGIPEHFIPNIINYNKFLIGGELKTWSTARGLFYYSHKK